MEGKYHTIDPIILETLNLNQRRMNHILDIIHGRQPRNYGNSDRKKINKSQTISLSKSHTIDHQLSHDQPSLPPITLTARSKKKANKRQDQVTQISPFMERKSRTIQKSRKSLTSEVESLKKRKQRQQKAQQKPVDVDKQVRLAQSQRREQVMQNYMYTKLKRSKSVEINPKDLYRLEIEHMVSQPTPIQRMEDAERKMQRLKKRCKHLFTFDKEYYSKLNQVELHSLS